MKSVATAAVLIGLGFAAGFVVGKSSSAAGTAPAAAGTPAGSGRPSAGGPAASASEAGSNNAVGIPAPADVIALLDGLKAGDDVATWKCAFIMLPSSGDMMKSVTVGLEKGDEKFVVSFAATGVLKYQANYSTEQYAFYYATETPGAPLAADRDAAVKAVQERVARTEKTVPRPSVL